MQKRTTKVAILAALTIVLVFSMSAFALAQPSQYSDLNGAIVGDYDITLEQVSEVADVDSGLFRPYADITRAEFATMAVNAFDIPLVNPATPSFPDVTAANSCYQYVEAAYAAGIINGYTNGNFGPNDTATRQQMLSIISRYVGAKAGYYDVTTSTWMFRTPAEIDALVAHFGDAAQIDPAHKTAMAFAYAMGITKGNAYGNLAPLSNLMRIQSAAMLIRSQALVPENTYYPTDVTLVSADKSENLIGQTHTLTFKATTASGHPAKGVLVDFDTIFANPLYVGNISSQAALTDAFGEVSVNLISTEPGTQRVSATVQTIDGPATTYSTKYWLAIDEIYIMDEELYAENNAGEEHTWCAQVVVFGPGPRSTSQFDWYNVIDASYDPADLDPDDGVEYGINDYADEMAMLDADEVVRSMAGIGIDWDVDWDLDDESVGTIVSEDVLTDEDGQACITIDSTVTGSATVTAYATYPENPYPQMLIDRDSIDGNWFTEDNWEAQGQAGAIADKLWIPHVIGGDADAPITPAYAVNNTGEVETFVLTLEDVYGNVIPGYTVEWWLQGVGFFKSDGTTWVGIGEQNKDIDVTDANGQATLDLKSLIPGQTIVHVKVMDKYGLPYKEWNVVKQWYSIDQVIMGQVVDGAFVHDTMEENMVNTGHTWTAFVGGAKYVYTMYDLNGNGLRDDQVLIGDRADMEAVAGEYANFDGTAGAAKAAGVDPAVGVPFTPDCGETWYVRFADMDLAGAEFWHDIYGADDIAEVWSGLAGKNVYFFNNQCYCGGVQEGNGDLQSAQAFSWLEDTAIDGLVGTITSPTMVVSDEMGFASVDINSTNKGYQCILVVADYAENPQDGNPLMPTEFAELRWATACKYWAADYGSDETIEIFANGVLGSASDYRWTNPILDWARESEADVLIDAPVAGVAATGTLDVGDGDIVTITDGGSGYTAADVGEEVTALAPAGADAAATAVLGVIGPTNNRVELITVTNGGSGYEVAPDVVIDAPDIAGGTQATAVANISSEGTVVSVTMTEEGSGYTAAPDVTFTPNEAEAVIGTIATVVDGAVTDVTVTAVLPDGTYDLIFPAPLKDTATATATVVDGVVTAIAVDGGGMGYTEAPDVTITGAGTGAFATATLTDGVVSAIAVLSGGSGYYAPVEAGDNPNRHQLCVSVFDEYGNALEGYKVTFEIVGQGTTTDGTIDTYHPYAHFEYPLHATGALLPGLSDLNPNIDANPYWGDPVDCCKDAADDDRAWGYTLNHEINFTTNPDYAACVDLVMDESDLEEYDHITNIVNIQVFDLSGARILEKEVTKIWSYEAPEPTIMVLEQFFDGDWTMEDATIYGDTMDLRGRVLDQFGNPLCAGMPMPDEVKLIAETWFLGAYQAVVWQVNAEQSPMSNDADGWAFGQFTGIEPFDWYVYAWWDADGDNIPDAGELQSNAILDTFIAVGP